MTSIQTRSRGARFLAYTGPCRCPCDRGAKGICMDVFGRIWTSRVLDFLISHSVAVQACPSTSVPYNCRTSFDSGDPRANGPHGTKSEDRHPLGPFPASATARALLDRHLRG